MDHHHGVVARGLAQDGGHGVAEAFAGVVEAIVHLVGQEPEPVPAGEIEQALLFVLAGHPAERIGWRCVKQQASARGHGGFEGLEIDAVALAAEGLGNLPDFGVRHTDIGGAIGPGGGQDQGFIAGIEDAPDSHVESLDTGSGDDDLAGRVEIHALQSAVVFRDGAPQGRKTGVFRIEGVAFGHGAQGGLFDVLRGRQVRFAEVQAQNAVHGHGDLRQFPYAGMRDGLHRGCDLRHETYCRTPAGFYNDAGMTQRFRTAAITDEFSPDIETAARSMAGIGMRGAELRMVFGKNVVDLTDEELERAMEIVRGQGLEIISIASPLLKCVLPDAPEVDARFQQDLFASKHTFADQPRLAARAFEIAARTGVAHYPGVLILENRSAGGVLRPDRGVAAAPGGRGAGTRRRRSGSKTSTPVISGRGRKRRACWQPWTIPT